MAGSLSWAATATCPWGTEMACSPTAVVVNRAARTNSPGWMSLTATSDRLSLVTSPSAPRGSEVRGTVVRWTSPLSTASARVVPAGTSFSLTHTVAGWLLATARCVAPWA